jgi:hypothetical protein
MTRVASEPDFLVHTILKQKITNQTQINLSSGKTPMTQTHTKHESEVT